MQAHKGPDGALLAQPPLPAAPSQGGRQARRSWGPWVPGGTTGMGEEVSTCLPDAGVHITGAEWC